MRMNIDGRTLRTLSLLAALLGGCVGGGGPSSKGTPSDTSKEPSSSDRSDSNRSDADDEEEDPWDDEDDEPRLPPFSRPFEGLVQNTARWASFEVVTKAARVERGMDDSWTDEEPDRGSIDPNETYAEIDLDIINTTVFDDELGERSTWDLILPDGTRIEQTNTLGLMAGPRGTIDFTLRYAVDEDFDLKGVVLELNGITRGELAPERIPLDAPYRADVDAVLTELQGKTFESARPTAFERRRLEIVTATASRNSAVPDAQQRSSFGKMFVELTLDLTMARSDNVLDGNFGIVVDGRLSRPINLVNELPDDDVTVRFPVLFEIDDTTKAFTVRMMLGWDDELTPETEWKDIEVHL